VMRCLDLPIWYRFLWCVQRIWSQQTWKVHLFKQQRRDELVQVIEGETTLVLLKDDVEHKSKLMPGELLVVPQGVWHRFESPKGLKVLTITPPPTEYSITKPTTI
jgi:mannose-6-phosphate isomerase-like protein (cupin superfamily)